MIIINENNTMKIVAKIICPKLNICACFDAKLKNLIQILITCNNYKIIKIIFLRIYLNLKK